MSSAPPDDGPARPDDGPGEGDRDEGSDETRDARSDEDRDPSEMTLTQHLRELRDRLVRVFIAVAIGAVAGWFVFEPLLDLIMRPYCRLPGAFRPEPDGACMLIVTRPLEAFSVRIRLSLVVGLFLAAPVLFHQLWRFIGPGLTARERRYTAPFVLGSVVLFVLGGAFAAFAIPEGLAVLLRMGGDQIATLLAAAEYFTFVLTIVVVFGLAFQVPLLIVFLALVGTVGTEQLRNYRPHAVVGTFVVAAIATPADPVTMFMLAVPMVALYEVAIGLTWLIERSRRRRAARAGEAET